MVEIRVGYELIYDCPQPTPMMLVLNIHYTRAADILVPDQLKTDPPVPIAAYRDSFGNWCSRIVAPKGQIRIASTAVVKDSGEPDVVATYAQQQFDTRFCLRKPSFFSWEADTAIQKSFPRPLGACSVKRRRAGVGSRRSAISCTTTSHSAMSMPRATRTAWGNVQRAARGLPRLRASCYCLLPMHEHSGALLHRLSRRHGARPPPYGPMDFAAWFEAYLGGRWYTFDPRKQRAADRASVGGKGP